MHNEKEGFLVHGFVEDAFEVLNSAKVIFDTQEDEIVIFPSKTLHGTELGTNSQRISISADIVLVAKDTTSLEHLMTPLKKWKLFSN